MRLPIVVGLARTEARTIRRLVRYWVFVALAAGTGFIAFLTVAAIHGFASTVSATVGQMGPRYIAAAYGFLYLIVFVVGLILLAFDVRSRDQRERIVEVLDTRPYSNLELVTGRLLGILVTAWLPVVGTVLAMELFGWVGRTLSWAVGGLIEPWSLLRLVVFMAIPTFAFMTALVFLLSLVVRYRFLTALLALTVVAVNVSAVSILGIDLNWVGDIFGGSGYNFASDLMPAVLTPAEYLQRLAVLVAAAGLVALAAAVHPRFDGRSRKRRAGAGVGLVLVALAMLGLLARHGLASRSRTEQWRTAHEARRDEPAADLEAIAGIVEVDPGHSLRMELEVGFAAPPNATLSTVLFTLNPGLVVERIADRAGGELAFNHQDGLLDVTLVTPLPAAGRTTLEMTIAGRPETAFGYLDSAIDPKTRPSEETAIIFLGIEPAIFDRHFVALMPGVRWLPAPGGEAGRDDGSQRPTDFFGLDLTVDLPAEWLAAGPGRRRESAEAAPGRVRYRFAPAAPVPEAAVIASRFVRRAFEVEGVELEVLVHPAHTRNLEVFAEAGGEIRDWIGERLREAAEIGLPYPYGALTLVEVPGVLRGFGGGWRMDTVMAPPAMLLMRETGFPTARFDLEFRDPEDFTDHEGGVVRAKRESLERFFAADFSGGNPFLGAARNFFRYQTAARGPGAPALDYVCHDLTTRLITGQEGFFSAHLFDSQDRDPVLDLTVSDSQSRGSSLARAFFDAVNDRPEVWEQALGVALSEIDPWEDPARTLSTVALKGDAMARSMLDGLGRRRTGELLAALRAAATGGSFDRDDLVAAAVAAETDLEALIGDWLDATAVPGFVASPVELFRLRDTADGIPQYQVALHLRNDEPAPGLVRLLYLPGGLVDGDAGPEPQRGAPVRVAANAAVEIGLVLSKPPRRLWVEPYFSLNRHPFRLRLPELDAEEIVAAEPLRGTRPSAWQPPAAEAIVVDDLDPGFRVETDEDRAGLRIRTAKPAGSRDQGAEARVGGATVSVRSAEPAPSRTQGLPLSVVDYQPPPLWSRRVVDVAWGKYRHTLAAVHAGQGRQRAVFTAELPDPGRWRLELFMVPPDPRPGPWRRGTYHLTVVDSADRREEILFDAEGSEAGWNLIGELDLAGGETRVELSDRSDGGAVLADAIRWQLQPDLR